MDGKTEEQVGEEREMKDASPAEALVSRKRDKSVEVEEPNKRPRLVEEHCEIDDVGIVNDGNCGGSGNDGCQPENLGETEVFSAEGGEAFSCPVLSDEDSHGIETGGESFSEEFVVEIPANDVADR